MVALRKLKEEFHSRKAEQKTAKETALRKWQEKRKASDIAEVVEEQNIEMCHIPQSMRYKNLFLIYLSKNNKLVLWKENTGVMMKKIVKAI